MTLGFGVDQGWSNVDLGALSESADVSLTQLGLSAGYENGPWFANLAGIAGFGDVHAKRGTAATTGISTASYGIQVYGAEAEAGYRLLLGGWQVVPEAGLDWTEVRSDAFTETGGMPLSAAAHSADRTRGWLGVAVGRTLPFAGMGLDLSASLKLIDVLSGRGRLLPVTFLGTPMTVTGISEGQYGADIGLAAALHISRRAKVFAAYDGEFRRDYQAHAGTVGIDVTW